MFFMPPFHFSYLLSLPPHPGPLPGFSFLAGGMAILLILIVCCVPVLPFNPVPPEVKCLVNCTTNGICVVHPPNSTNPAQSPHKCLCLGLYTGEDCSSSPSAVSPFFPVPTPPNDTTGPINATRHTFASPLPRDDVTTAPAIAHWTDQALKLLIVLLLAAIVGLLLCNRRRTRHYPLRRVGAFRRRLAPTPSPPILRWSRPRQSPSPSPPAGPSRQPTSQQPALSRRFACPTQPRLPIPPVLGSIAPPGGLPRIPATSGDNRLSHVSAEGSIAQHGGPPPAPAPLQNADNEDPYPILPAGPPSSCNLQ
jgi:hypothetical protein